MKIALIAVLFVLPGCSFLQSPQGAGTVQTVEDTVVCILNHSTESVTQIVTDCGSAVAQDVIQKILDAHTAAEAREKAAAK